jgi:hypothetical protein
MRFVQFEDSGNRRVGVELKENGDIVDLWTDFFVIEPI